jgi:hypothetical protein
MLDLRLPPICDFSVTNVCNAACDFCGFARDKTLIGAARYVDAEAFSRALPILHRRGIRYMTLQGGESLVHPDIVRLVSQTVAAGMSCAIITNGWFLPRYITSLAAAGLYQLIVSSDSATLADHERNRGLEGVGAPSGRGNRAGACVRPTSAGLGNCQPPGPLTTNCRITLRRLGFDDVAFLIRGVTRSAPLPWSTGKRRWWISTATNCWLRWT